MVTAGDHEVSGGGQAGLHSLDTLCGPLLSGQLVLIIGRPRLGKTTLILDVARRVSVCEGRPVLLFSLEHPQPAVRRRLLAAQTGLSLMHVARGLPCRNPPVTVTPPPAMVEGVPAPTAPAAPARPAASVDEDDFAPSYYEPQAPRVPQQIEAHGEAAREPSAPRSELLPEVDRGDDPDRY